MENKLYGVKYVINFNKNEFKFEVRENVFKVNKITLRFYKAKKDGFYRITFIKYNVWVEESEGWHHLNNYLDEDSLTLMQYL